MELDGYRLRTPGIKVVKADSRAGAAQIEITIHEGRNRQVRRMCAIAGMDVTRLTRIKEDNLILGDLKAGQWRYLTEQEIAELKK